MRYRQNFRDKHELERAALTAAGLISERHAAIAGIEFRMTYYRRGVDPVLMARTLKFLPADHAWFRLKCMEEGCTNGGYDLSPIVAGLVRSRKTSGKGKLFCHGENQAIGHASLAYEITIQYHRT